MKVVGKHLLEATHKILTIKEKDDKLDFIKIKNICSPLGNDS